MAKVPDVMRVRRLLRALRNLENELSSRDISSLPGWKQSMYHDGCSDLTMAANYLDCAMSDFRDAEEMEASE